MTVGELIEELSNYDPSLEVFSIDDTLCITLGWSNTDFQYIDSIDLTK